MSEKLLIPDPGILKLLVQPKDGTIINPDPGNLRLIATAFILDIIVVTA
jgi:hypothetical protein